MDFWSPTFEYETREDGTVLMRHTEALPHYKDTIADYLDYWAEKSPDSTLLAQRDANDNWQKISYSEMRDLSRIVGAALLSMGLGPDRPLLILSEKSITHGVLGMACTYVGIPYAPVSPAYSLVSSDHGKLKTIAALLTPGAVFAEDSVKFAPALDAIVQADCQVICEHNLSGSQVSYHSLLEHDTTDSETARQAIGPDTVVKYLFTSGSTGAPKAVINTNRMICSMEAMVRDCYRFLEREPPIVLNWLPWNHTAGGNKVFYMVLTNGGAYYIDDGNPSPSGLAKTVRNLRDIACTWYFNVPAGYDGLVDSLESDTHLSTVFFSKLRMLFYAGAGMAQHTWDRLGAISKQATGRDVLIATGLGSTETAPFALAWTELERQAGNIGVPSRGLTLKLVPHDEKLEIRLKGPSITPGYYGDLANTAAVFDDEGFYMMGDALRPADPNDFSRGFFFDGRLAENFKLSTGTWVAVGAVRGVLVNAMQGLIRDTVIVGENESELGALVLLSESASSIETDSLKEQLLSYLDQHVRNATGSASRVMRIAILATDPSFDRGEVTEKGSLNQRAMRANNAELIAALYAGDQRILTESKA